MRKEGSMDMNNLSGSPDDFKEGTGDVDALVEAGELDLF
jgi:hypothetical protein